MLILRLLAVILLVILSLSSITFASWIISHSWGPSNGYPILGILVPIAAIIISALSAETCHRLCLKISGIED